MGSVLTRNESVLKRVDKIRSILERVRDLQDSQMEATLLRSCLSLPKVVFALRTCPQVHIFHALQTFDHIMLEALSDLAGGPLSNWAWRKVSLPSSLGGLGIRWVTLHAPAAYISSLDQSSALVTEILRKSPRAGADTGGVLWVLKNPPSGKIHYKLSRGGFRGGGGGGGFGGYHQPLSSLYML